MDEPVPSVEELQSWPNDKLITAVRDLMLQVKQFANYHEESVQFHSQIASTMAWIGKELPKHVEGTSTPSRSSGVKRKSRSPPDTHQKAPLGPDSAYQQLSNNALPLADTFNDYVLRFKSTPRHPELVGRLKAINSTEFDELQPDGAAVVLAVVIDWLWDPYLVINGLVYLFETMTKFREVFTTMPQAWITKCGAQLTRMLTDEATRERLDAGAVGADEVVQIVTFLEEIGQDAAMGHDDRRWFGGR